MSQTPLYGTTNSVNSGVNRGVKHQQQQHIIQSPNTRVPNIDMLSYNSNNSNNNNSVNSNITVVTEAGGNSYAVTNTTLDQTTSISNHNTNTGAIPKEKSAKNSNKPQQPRKPPPTIETFWPNILQEVQNAVIDSKHQSLPLARIKKIMKLDENAKMIAAEAPTLFAKACEFFIQELTMRAWIHTDESKRRTLQRSDIAQAIANYDQFDFLIDIVPREDIKPPSHRRHHHETASSANNPTNSSGTQSPANNTMTNTVSNVVTGEILNVAGLPLDNITTAQPTTATIAGNLTQTQPATQMLNAAAAAATSANHNTPQLQIIQQAAHPQQHLQYFITIPGQQPGQAQLVHQLQLQQQQQQHLNNGLTTAGTPLTTASLNLVAQQPQQLILTAANPSAAHAAANVVQHQQQTALLQNIAQQQQQQHAPQQQVQLLQQVMLTPNGEITNMPIAINANQLNLLRLQMHQHQQQQQQQQQHQQQVIIPTHLLTAQQLLQLQAQQNHAQANTATTTHIVHHQPQHQVVQQQQAHQHQQQQQTQLHPQTTTNNIYINSNAIATNPATTGTTVAAGSSMVSTDRNMGSTFRNNC